jgi:hypothetical protein
MTSRTRQALTAAAPVFGTTLAIAVLQAAHLPFPLALHADAWPQWVVFMALVYSLTNGCLYVIERLGGADPQAKPGASRSGAA